MADEDGVSWSAIRSAAQVIRSTWKITAPMGRNHHFDFAAVAMSCAQRALFPPRPITTSAGHEFSVGWEAGAFVEDVLAGANRDMKEAKELLSRAFEQQARAVDAIASQVEKGSGWKFMGLDPTPAPLTDSSIGAAIETVIGAKFGSSGTLSAAAIITEAERSISVKPRGASPRLMLPVLEDPVPRQEVE